MLTSIAPADEPTYTLSVARYSRKRLSSLLTLKKLTSASDTPPPT